MTNLPLILKTQPDVPQTPDWRRLFREPVVEIARASEGYANDVWVVRTEKCSYVVKATRAARQPNRPFWDGILTLFGMSVYGHMSRRRALAQFIQRHSPLRIPRVVRIDLSERLFPRPFVVYEKLPGQPAPNPFAPAGIVRTLGEHLGRLHGADFSFWGSYPTPPSFPLKDWPERVARSIDALARRWFSDQPAVIEALPHFLALARKVPPPASACLILPDLRPAQFLVYQDNLSALVDVEAHVLGPRELDFVALEYSLPPQSVPAFTEGYTRSLPLPDLEPVRSLYRYLYWVMAALGKKDYNEWMEHPALF